jgi:hypothetical protein
VLEFKDVAPFLGVLLPAIGAIFMYRAAERQRAREVDKAVQAAPLGVVAAITDKDAGVQMASSIDALADAMRKGVSIMREEREDQGRRAQIERALNELTALRRELEEIVHLLKHRHDRQEESGAPPKGRR